MKHLKIAQKLVRLHLHKPGETALVVAAVISRQQKRPNQFARVRSNALAIALRRHLREHKFVGRHHGSSHEDVLRMGISTAARKSYTCCATAAAEAAGFTFGH